MKGSTRNSKDNFHFLLNVFDLLCIIFSKKNIPKQPNITGSDDFLPNLLAYFEEKLIYTVEVRFSSLQYKCFRGVIHMHMFICSPLSQTSKWSLERLEWNEVCVLLWKVRMSAIANVYTLILFNHSPCIFIRKRNITSPHLRCYGQGGGVALRDWRLPKGRGGANGATIRFSRGLFCAIDARIRATVSRYIKSVEMSQFLFLLNSITLLISAWCWG